MRAVAMTGVFDPQMTGHGAKFGRKQEEAIAALLTYRTVEEAAGAVKIAPKTLLRWLEIPAFKAKYLKARREGVYQAVARMQHATHNETSWESRCLHLRNAPLPGVSGAAHRTDSKFFR